MSAQVVPTSGICESSTFRSTAPPLGIEPAAIEPAAVEPNPIEPAAIEPAAIDPAAIEPAANEPAGPELTSAVSDARRLPGIEPYGTEAMPAGIDGSSELMVSAL